VKIDRESIVKREGLDSRVILGSHLVRTSGFDGEVVILSKSGASSVKDTIDSRSNVINDKVIIEIKAVGSSKNGCAGIDFNFNVISKSLNEESDVRSLGLGSSVVEIEIIITSGLTVLGGANLINDNGLFGLKFIEKNGNLVDSKVVLDIRAFGTSVERESKVIEATNVVVVDGRRRPCRDIIVAVVGGRETFVVEDRELETSSSNVLDHKVENVIIGTRLSARREMEGVVSLIFDTSADGLINSKDNGLFVRLNAKLVVDGVKFTSLLDSTDGNPDSGGSRTSGFSRVTKITISKVDETILSISNVGAGHS